MSDPNLLLTENETDEPSCLDLIDETVIAHDGIVDVELDTAGETVTFAYDPRRVNEGDIARLAHEVGPILQDRWQTCTCLLYTSPSPRD